MQNALGERLKAKRIVAGLGVVELAAKLEVDRTQVWRWETGAAEPPLFRLRQVARALGCSLKSLLPDDRRAA